MTTFASFEFLVLSNLHFLRGLILIVYLTNYEFTYLPALYLVKTENKTKKSRSNLASQKADTFT